MTEDKVAITPLTEISDLLKSRDLHDILNTGRKLLRNPLILTDLAHRVIAYTDEPELTDPVWQSITGTGSIPIMWTSCEPINNCYQRSIEKDAPILDSAPDGGQPTLRKALTIHGNLIGYLDSPCYSGDVNDDEQAAFDVIANLCAIQMSRSYNFLDYPDDLMEFFVADLLAGRLSDGNMLAERLSYFHWDISCPYRVISARLTQKADLHKTQNEDQRIHNICEHFSNGVPGVISFIYGKQIKFIVTAKHKACTSAEEMEKLENEFLDEGLSVGISRPFMKTADIPQANQQSEKSLELGLLLHPETGIFHYDKYSPFHVIEICSRNEDAIRFCHSAIFILGDYDKQHETQMLDTLQAYLIYHRNIAEAARALYVHRNTMNYRINKITSLLGIDIDDPEIAYQLLFSFHILEYYSATVHLDSEEQKNRKTYLSRQRKEKSRNLHE
jgi:sugar diacid utilization regulator